MAFYDAWRGVKPALQHAPRTSLAEKLREAEAEAEEATPMADAMLSDWPEEKEATDMLPPWSKRSPRRPLFCHYCHPLTSGRNRCTSGWHFV